MADDGAARPLGPTEQSWARAVPGGTGITVLALLLSPPPDLARLEAALHGLQNSHPILRASVSPSSLFPVAPLLKLESLSIAETSELLLSLSAAAGDSQLGPLHLLLERELNRNPWADSAADLAVFFATCYELPESKAMLALRLHTVACDRTSAAAALRELPELLTTGGAKGREGDALGLAIEALIPGGRGDKPFWTRGLDLLGYSLNLIRWAHLPFEDVWSTRSSGVVRLQVGPEETSRILQGCNARGIKLSRAIVAAGLIAAHSTREMDGDRAENYSVVTLLDCRKTLQTPLHDHNLGFYHSAILNTHSITAGEALWDVAARCHRALTAAIDSDKQFKDMGALNFLMCKAMENPAVTPASSLRISYMVVFEDAVVDNGSPERQCTLGLEDYMGCSSVHGVGPSIAVFDTVRGGRLDCACVYPSPLHSRQQMVALVERMKDVLVREAV